MPCYTFYFRFAPQSVLWRRGNKKARGFHHGLWLVGVAGFEPTTSCTPSKRATGLRYTPNLFYLGKAKVLFSRNFCQSFCNFLIDNRQPYSLQGAGRGSP